MRCQSLDIFIYFRDVHSTVKKLVWCQGEPSSNEILFALSKSTAVVNYVAEYTLIVVYSTFLTGSVIKAPWIVCAGTEHDTGIPDAHDEHVTKSSLRFKTFVVHKV